MHPRLGSQTIAAGDRDRNLERLREEDFSTRFGLRGKFTWRAQGGRVRVWWEAQYVLDELVEGT